jgi:hypothetical protein
MQTILSADKVRKDQCTYSGRKTVQKTYPKRQPAKPVSHYILSITLLAVMVLIINVMVSVALPDPLGDKIQSHMTKFKPTPTRGR